MIQHPISEEAPTELAFRACAGIEVALLWNKARGRATVAVYDEDSGESFQLVVRETDDPLDIFYHPYAYAASRRSAHSETEAVNV